jgi:hypothetical protein
MPDKNCVLICGKSLNLAGIASCLGLDENLDVVFIDPLDSNTRGYLEERGTEAIIFDLTDPPGDLDVNLLRQRPGLLLIGVDPSSDEVFVLKGQRSKVVTAEELTKLIASHTNDKVVKKRD